MRKMKDSGIEWIGQIPEEWKTKRIKEIFSEINERCNNGNEYTLLSVSEYYGVAPRNENISSDDMLTHAASLDGYKICHPHDIVMNIMLAWKRALGVSDYLGIISPAYCVYRAKIDIVHRYFHYLFRTEIYANLFKQYSTGIIDSRLRLYPEKFLSLKCHFPEKCIQSRIADFLDDKCGKIDSYIEKQQQIIEKLKAYKQSVITEAVTKGLNPDVPMKDSGIEWIGEIPKHWEIRRLRYLGTCVNGISKGGEFFGRGYPFVSYGDVYKNMELPTEASGLAETTESEREWYSVKEGDVFFTRTSETIEEVALTSTCMRTIENATFAGFLIRFRPNTDLLTKEFSKYYFRSDKHRLFFVKEMNLVTRASLSQELLKRLPVLLPSSEEQKKIAEFLGRKCNEIDAAIRRKQSVIDKLTEYKKSLIYEAVTGKVYI